VPFAGAEELASLTKKILEVINFKDE